MSEDDMGAIFTPTFFIIVLLCVIVILFFWKRSGTQGAHLEGGDLITGLMTRKEGEKRIKAAMAEAPGCLAFIDLDNLKPINDTFGHLAGDHALKVVSEVLVNHGQDAVISRIGGDEFLFYMPDVDEGKATFIIDCIMDSFRGKRETDKVLSFASLSIGLCLSTPNDTYADVYQKADKALYFIKQNGKDAYYFYHHAFTKMNERPSVDLAKLVDSIRKQGSYKGALGVEYREFTHLYEFITNLAIRYDQNLQLIMITLEPLNAMPSAFSPEILEDAMSCMNTAIRNSLRNVDVCTRFSSQQFLIILTNAGEENISLIVDRIFGYYHKIFHDRNIHVHYEAANLKEDPENK